MRDNRERNSNLSLNESQLLLPCVQSVEGLGVSHDNGACGFIRKQTMSEGHNLFSLATPFILTNDHNGSSVFFFTPPAYV